MKNYPCFMILTSMSLIGLTFSVQGIKVKKLGREVTLDEGI